MIAELKKNIELASVVMNAHEKIKLYRETFRGRQDIVPHLWISKNGKKTGYSLICSHEME